MSLASRLTDLAAAIGADVKQAQLGRNLPAYAPRTAKNSYDPRNNTYNLKGSNTKHAHAGITRALNGGKMNILGFGDSVYIGYDGTPSVCQQWRAIPRLVGRFMAQSLGLSEAGGMIPTACSPGLTPTDMASTTGTVSHATGYSTLFSGAKYTMTPDKSGTIVDVYYSDLSAAFTVNIDNTGPVTVTPTGTAAMKRYRVTGLTDTIHTVVLTANANYLFVSFISVSRTVGIGVDNIAWGGARLTSGGPTVNWLDTTNAANVQIFRKGAFDLNTVVPDLVVASIGGNDIPNGATPDDFATAFTTVRNWYPSSDFHLLVGPGLTSATQTAWDAFCGRMYTMADDLDIVITDTRDRCGYATEANSLGYIGADGFHEVQGAMWDWARIIANAYTGSGPGAFYNAPAGVTSLANQPDGLAVGVY